MPDLVLTLIGPDRPGIVESIAQAVVRNGGNWLESRMAHLAGKFAGILRVEVPAGGEARLTAALLALEGTGLKLAVEVGPASAARAAERSLELDLVGLDRPGIIREISGALAEHGANIEELTSDRTVAAMSGELLFRSRARVTVPQGADPERLRERLERLADDLMVQISVAEPE